MSNPYSEASLFEEIESELRSRKQKPLVKIRVRELPHPYSDIENYAHSHKGGPLYRFSGRANPWLRWYVCIISIAKLGHFRHLVRLKLVLEFVCYC